jgi:hypothetical protein
MPQGDRRKEIDLFDSSYDGDTTPPTSQPAAGSTSGSGGSSSDVGLLVAPMRLSGGLGQLTDGDEGQSNFRLDPRGTGLKGNSIHDDTIVVALYAL